MLTNSVLKFWYESKIYWETRDYCEIIVETWQSILMITLFVRPRTLHRKKIVLISEKTISFRLAEERALGINVIKEFKTI